eukprot:5536768-Pyramimonas_sp.AAC.1
MKADDLIQALGASIAGKNVDAQALKARCARFFPATRPVRLLRLSVPGRRCPCPRGRAPRATSLGIAVETSSVWVARSASSVKRRP